MLTLFDDEPQHEDLIRRLLGLYRSLDRPLPLLRRDQPDEHLTGQQKFLRYLAWTRLAAMREVWCLGHWYEELNRFGDARLSINRRRVLERLALARQVLRVRSTHTRPDDRLPALGVPIPRIGTDLMVATHARDVYDLMRVLRAPPNDGPGVGAYRNTSVVLVGERPNPNATQPYLGPFCSASGVGCSAWLARQLEEAGVRERDLYWINAFDEHGAETSPVFLADLKPRAVIALGQVAATWCERHLVGVCFDYHSVPHPQHWKRFHHHERYPLLDLLTAQPYTRLCA
jgi:hypothetical protein